MTLEIKIDKITSKLNNPDLYISGTKTGTYRIQNSFSPHDQRRIAFFAQNQSIEFSLYEENLIPESSARKAYVNYPCSLIKEFILEKIPEDNEPQPYNIELYNKKDESIATVHMLVGYERGLMLMGSFPREHQKKLKGHQFYKGIDPAGIRNAFNFLDWFCCSAMVDQEFKSIESVYGDKYQ